MCLFPSHNDSRDGQSTERETPAAPPPAPPRPRRRHRTRRSDGDATRPDATRPATPRCATRSHGHARDPRACVFCVCAVCHTRHSCPAHTHRRTLRTLVCPRTPRTETPLGVRSGVESPVVSAVSSVHSPLFKIFWSVLSLSTLESRRSPGAASPVGLARIAVC